MEAEPVSETQYSFKIKRMDKVQSKKITSQSNYSNIILVTDQLNAQILVL